MFVWTPVALSMILCKFDEIAAALNPAKFLF